MPVFMVAMLLQYVFAYHLHWLPIAGVRDWRGFILPAVALGWNSAGSVARLVRSTLLEILEEDYIDTARAKGRGQLGVLVLHALRNAMLPVITSTVAAIPLLFMGSLVMESFFGIPGLGSYTIDAIGAQDFTIVRSMVFLGTFAYVIGLIATDIVYAAADPRIRLR